MKTPILKITIFSVISILNILYSLAQEDIPKKKNILFILVDDQRANTINYLGNTEIKTPHLDKLASQGTCFTNAYIMGSYSGAVCMPSRAMLLSGKYLNNLSGKGFDIPPTDTLLGESLQAAGYHCFGTGKYHNKPETFYRCFNDGMDIFFGGMQDHWNVPLNTYESSKDYIANQRPVIDNPYSSNKITYQKGQYTYGGKHSTDIFTKTTIDFIENYKSDKPFFLYVSLMTPHDPRSTYQKYIDLYDTAEISIPSNFLPQHPFNNGDLQIRDEKLAEFPRNKQEIKEHIRDYYALISHNDEKIGEIIEALKKKGLYNNTIIIFTGDNGLALGQHGLMGKQNLYEHSTKVPLIFSGEGIPKNVKIEALVSLTDLYPTICDLVNVDIPGSVDGASFFSLLENPVSEHHQYIYTSYKLTQRAIRNHRYKLILYNVNGEKHMQLFDLLYDPYESNNLIGNKKYHKVHNHLMDKMNEMAIKYNDLNWFF
jgi:arylsulfatase A-like enzyme